MTMMMMTMVAAEKNEVRAGGKEGGPPLSPPDIHQLRRNLEASKKHRKQTKKTKEIKFPFETRLNCLQWKIRWVRCLSGCEMDGEDWEVGRKEKKQTSRRETR